MRKFKHLIVGILCTAGLAFAVAQSASSVDKVNSPKPQHFVSGTFTGSEAKNPLSDTKNKQAYHLCGTLVYEFPVITGTHTNCQESAALTIAGCGFNDRLSLGMDQVFSNTLVQFNPVVTAANTVKVVQCANGVTDGGSYDSPDASFTVCCDGY
jgi:hypothetical protein